MKQEIESPTEEGDMKKDKDMTIYVHAPLCVWVLFVCSHDFIGEFTTSYRELSRGQNQFNVYEVRNDLGVVCCFLLLSSPCNSNSGEFDILTLLFCSPKPGETLQKAYTTSAKLEN